MQEYNGIRIPDELYAKGVRWVEQRQILKEGQTFLPRIIIKENDYECRLVQKDDVENFTSMIKPWDDYACDPENIREIREPKKIPYTVETFPMWAVWIRNKEWDKEVRSSIIKVIGKTHSMDAGINMYFHNENQDEKVFNRFILFSEVDDWEIAGVDGTWKPFYQTKEHKVYNSQGGVDTIRYGDGAVILKE